MIFPTDEPIPSELKMYEQACVAGEKGDLNALKELLATEGLTVEVFNAIIHDFVSSCAPSKNPRLILKAIRLIENGKDRDELINTIFILSCNICPEFSKSLEKLWDIPEEYRGFASGIETPILYDDRVINNRDNLGD